MNILNRFVRRRTATKEAPVSHVAAGALGGFFVPPGVNIDGYLRMYGRIGWLFGAVSRIAEAVSDVKWRLYQYAQGEREEIDTHPVLDLLHEVNPFMTGHELIETHQMYMDLVGESYWILARNGKGPPKEIWPVPPSRMRIVPDSTQFIRGYIYQFGVQTVPLSLDEVIYIKRPNPADPYRGLGPAQSIGVDLQSEQFSAEWNRNFFFNSASPGAVITYPDQVTSDEYDRLREQWNSEHRGLTNAHKVAILSGGATVSQLAFSQRDMEFWRQRKLNRDNILGAFGVPLSVMGISENVNRANAESGEYVFARWVIKPRLTRLREKLNEQLMPMFGGDGLMLDFDDPVPENREALLREATEGVRSYIYTINEGRQMLGFDEVTGGDVFMVPLSLIPVSAKKWAFLAEAKATPVLECGHARLKIKWNEEQKESFWRQFATRTESDEKPIAQSMRQAFSEQEKLVLAKLKEARKPADALFPRAAADRKVKSALMPELEKVMARAIIEAEGLVRPENPHTDGMKQDEPPVSGAALEWLRKHAGVAVKDINDTTLEALRLTLAEGFEGGEAIPELADRVRRVFADADERRAIMIARTEVINASAQGHIEGYRTSGVVDRVQFYSALDERACDLCNEDGLHGTVYPLDESEGIIAVHPACRCVFLPVLEGE